MSGHANRNAWNEIQNNKKYLNAYQEWCRRQFLFSKFTGGYYVFKEESLNEEGKRYAETLFGLLVLAEKDKSDNEIREALAEVEAMGVLDFRSFYLLKEKVKMMVLSSRLFDEVTKSNEWRKDMNMDLMPVPEIHPYSSAEFTEDFQEEFSFSMMTLWFQVFEAAKPYTPFNLDLWPLNPHSDYEEVKKFSLKNPLMAADFLEFDGRDQNMLVKIDPRMPNGAINQKIKAILETLREKENIQVAKGSGMLKGVKKGMREVSPELSEQIKKDFGDNLTFADLTRKYYGSMKRADDQPLSDYNDITQTRIYQKIRRFLNNP